MLQGTMGPSLGTTGMMQEPTAHASAVLLVNGLRHPHILTECSLNVNPATMVSLVDALKVTSMRKGTGLHATC